MVRDDENNWSLQRIREFQLSDSPVAAIVPEHRRKGFLATDVEGNVGVFYTTAGRTLLREKLSEGAINQLAISPRSNYLMVDSGGTTHSWRLTMSTRKSLCQHCGARSGTSHTRNRIISGSHPLQTTTSNQSSA